MIAGLLRSPTLVLIVAHRRARSPHDRRTGPHIRQGQPRQNPTGVGPPRDRPAGRRTDDGRL